MIRETSAYNFLSGAFQILYKNRENQLHGNPPDMMSGLEMKPYFQDPQQRFLPVDFQDFWICQDVQGMFYHLGRRAATSFPLGSYCTPSLQWQPQPKNYEGTRSSTQAYAGHYVKYLSYSLNEQSFYPYGTQAYQVMSCDSDAPGILNGLGDQVSFVGTQSSHAWSWFANAEVYSTISGYMLTGDVSVFDDLSVMGHEPSAYMPLHSPCYTEALSAAVLGHPRKVFQVADRYSNCFFSNEAEISVFNDGNPMDYMWCFLNDSCGECANMRNERSAFSADYEVTWEYPSHRAVPGQQAYWANERVPGSNPTMYRQYIRQEMTNGCPTNDHSEKNYRLYSQAPAFCYYGDLSADVYLMWRVNFGGGEPLQFYAKKMQVEFERSDYFCSGYHPYLGRYAMQSKKTWSFDELFCLWNPTEVDSIGDAANGLRELAGLSAWTFPQGPFPREDYDKWPAHSVQLYFEAPFVVWKFSHPLIEEPGYHFPNQDESSSE